VGEEQGEGGEEQGEDGVPQQEEVPEAGEVLVLVEERHEEVVAASLPAVDPQEAAALAREVVAEARTSRGLPQVSNTSFTAFRDTTQGESSQWRWHLLVSIKMEESTRGESVSGQAYTPQPLSSICAKLFLFLARDTALS